MRIPSATIAATAIALGLVLASCGNDDKDKAESQVSAIQSQASALQSQAQSAVQSALSNVPSISIPAIPTDIGKAIDEGKVTAFVATYKAGYGELAEGLDDAAIEKILTDTCADIKSGKSDADLTKALKARAKNGSNELSDTTAPGLLEYIKVSC